MRKLDSRSRRVDAGCADPVCAPTEMIRRGGLDRLPVVAPESRSAREQCRCGRSGQIARAAAACAGAGKRSTDSESGAEAGARGGEDRAGGDPRRPTPMCEDGAGARSSRGAAQDRLGQGRPHPRPLWDRSLKDARRSHRSATWRADQPLAELSCRRRLLAGTKTENPAGASRRGSRAFYSSENPSPAILSGT